MSDLSGKKAAVLLATFNGEAFLEEQLASIRNQSHDQIDVWVSDDGSSDATIDILSDWSQRWSKGRFVVSEGPRQGFAENFRKLLLSVEGEYDGYFFSDQDDIWLETKIERALYAVAASAPGPTLYGARTWLADERAQPVGLSPLFSRPKTFENALVQSMAGGNTMMLNTEAFALLAESARRTGFVTHDWWAYMLVAGCGGTIIYDPEPSVLYRQHENNVIGKNSGLKASILRLKGMAKGQFRVWAESNIRGLEACKDMLSPSSQATLAKWKDAHAARPPLGVVSLWRSRVYRQNLRGNVMLWVAAAAGWL